MFCSSDSCDSAMYLLKPRSRPVAMELFYFVYSLILLLTRVRGRSVLRSSLLCRESMEKETPRPHTLK